MIACKRCLIDRPDDQYYVRADGSKYKYCTQCTDQRREYAVKNKSKVLKFQRDFYAEDPHRYDEKRRAWRKSENGINCYNSPEGLKKKRELMRAWKRKNKLSVRIRNRIYRAIKDCDAGIRKCDKSIELLGCSFNQLREYIAHLLHGDMTWGKVMSGEIHLDHIRPISSFDLSIPENQYLAFNYRNLQPLWAKDNISKGAKWSLTEESTPAASV